MIPQLRTRSTIIDTIEYSPSWDVVMLYLRPKLDGDENKNSIFQAGQFMMLATDIDNKRMQRPYSIASSPLQYVEEWLVAFSIKRVEWGVRSTRACIQAKQWDIITMTWPVWHLIATKQQSAKYLFVSVGSWLSPIYSLFRDIVIDTNTYIRIANIFWERSFDHMLPSVHKTWTKSYANVQTQLFLSQDEHVWYTKWYVQDWLANALNFLSSSQQYDDIKVFLCGKPAMVDDVQQRLHNIWFQKNQIIFEKY